ncbi:DinB family protein [candidate division KSB1 bacterium]|nr:DinB family protein [candidate division KSB1 bacterium]
MAVIVIPKPAPSEYNPYYEKYVSKIAEGDVLALLQAQNEATVRLLNKVPESHAAFCYAPEKWSIKEVVGHLCDTERIMSYRALRIGRGDATPLPGFEQDDYVQAAQFDSRTLADLVNEFQLIRQATLALFRAFDETALLRTGTANNSPASTRALAYIIAGHEKHHVQVLRERYKVAG